MVNFVLSFCKITGSSKIFKRHFYLPLLKPLTPKEALRTLRITGKWLLGAKIQHYIPVLLNHRQKRSKRCKNYGTKKHEHMDDFTYMSPVLDPENESHKLLLKILDCKKGDGAFVYTVEDKKYNIVFQGNLEEAIRDGDIIDIMVSQKNDKIIIKLKECKKIPVEIQYYEGSDDLFCGEGATTAEEEKFHHHGKYTMSLAKVFEDKETKEEEWEQQLKKIMKRRKKHKLECTKAWKQMVKENVKNLDWKRFEEDAKQVIDEINEPVSEQPIAMEIDNLESTKNVNEALSKNELLNQLPTIKEISDVIKNMGSADLHEIETEAGSNNLNKRRVSGVKVKLSSGKECFISGQMVHTEEGDVFVPGQTVENEFGDEYAPGITINVDNKPTLISGLIMGEEQRDPMFLPTQSTITSDGQLTFATTVEERPEPQPEETRLRTKLMKQKKEKEDKEKERERMQMLQEEEEAMLLAQTINDIMECIDENKACSDLIEIVVENISDDESSATDSEDKASSIELNNSEIEELDIEAIRLKQEQQRLEIEKLKHILMDDGMDDVISSLEEKKAKLKEKLEELRKLSMHTENNLITYAYDNDAIEIASKITQDQDVINRLSEILLTMTRRLSTLRDKNSIRADNIQTNIITETASETEKKFNTCSNKLKILFKTAMVTANDMYKNRPKDQILALNAIGEIVADSLSADKNVLNELLDLMNTPLERSEVCNAVLKQLAQDITETKVCLLHTVASKNLQPTDLYDYITKIFDSENIVCSSFLKISKIDTDLIKNLITEINNHLGEVKSEESAVIVLQKCMVNATRSILESNIKTFIETNSETNVAAFIEEALNFAKALDYDVVDDLSKPIDLEKCDDKTLEMLKRMLLIRLLAERDYSLKTAITRIKKNPECAKSDPRIRQLIRESAVLISNAPPLRNSRDIPIQLMKKQNLLAIEDFLMQRVKVEYPVLISRNSYQAVIPKEAARGVLAGRVSYALIDETGITNFKPMHMMSAISVNKNRERRIDDYLSAGGRERSSEKEDNRTYLQAKNNGTDDIWSSSSSRIGSRRTMSSGPLYRGYAGPRA